MRFDHSLKQGEDFQILVAVYNQSPIPLPRVSVACNFTPMNQFFNTFVDGLIPFGQVEVAIPARLDSGGGSNVTANCAIDVNSLVTEINEQNNFFNLTTALAAP